MTEQSFEKLTTWQKAHQLMLDIHKKLIPVLPKEEKYDLADQVKRSSKSVPANIAEGAGRYYYMVNVRFCYNAGGSLDERLNHLITARDLGYCPIALYQDLRSQIEGIRRLRNGYITWLKTKKIGENEPGAKLVIHEIPPEHFVNAEYIGNSMSYFSLLPFTSNAFGGRHGIHRPSF